METTYNKWYLIHLFCVPFFSLNIKTFLSNAHRILLHQGCPGGSQILFLFTSLLPFLFFLEDAIPQLKIRKKQQGNSTGLPVNIQHPYYEMTATKFPSFLFGTQAQSFRMLSYFMRASVERSTIIFLIKLLVSEHYFSVVYGYG